MVNLKQSNFNNITCILGIGKGFLSIHLLNCLKSVMKQAVPVFVSIIQVGALYLKLCLNKP